jgi:hypothetical protein
LIELEAAGTFVVFERRSALFHNLSVLFEALEARGSVRVYIAALGGGTCCDRKPIEGLLEA